MKWSGSTLESHLETGKILSGTLEDSLVFLKNNIGRITEYKTSLFVEAEFATNGLISDENPPIVAFRESTSLVHYFPHPRQSKMLETNSLVMIDLWARKNGRQKPFSDITWMAYCGEKIPMEIDDKFNLVRDARDEAVSYIKKCLESGEMPVGKAVDDTVRSIFNKEGQLKHFLHTTGHSLGFNSPHGELSGINQRNMDELLPNIAYTIEPGLYYPGRFGIRSEIDFYINNKKELVITTPVQKEIELI